MSTNLPDIEKLVEAWTPVIRKAFLDAVDTLRERVPLALVIRFLEKGDVDGALRAVGLEPAAFRPLDTAVAQTYEAGGTLSADAVPALRFADGYRLKILFNARNLRAEAWLKQHSSQLVTDVVEDQKVAIRQHLEAGMAKGLNPRTVALDLVGRINPVTKKREGGVIGLTSGQEKWVRQYEAELKAGDRSALKRNLRDKRFDKTIEKAISDGKPIPAAKIAKMVTAYKTRALRYRAESVARTEAMGSLHKSQTEAMEQAIERGQVQAGQIEKTWDSALDTRVRHTHRVLNGQTVGFREYFVSPSGAKLRHPGDPDAPVEEIVNCRCNMRMRINFLRAAQPKAA